MFAIIENWAQAIGFWPVVGVMVVAFAILAKSADWLVEGAIEIAQRLHVRPMLIGIVLVSLGTTAPELAVSIKAALSGQAAMALGNAVGSVIYDDGIALPLAALFAPVVILIDRTVLRSAAIFLIAVDIVAYILCLDGILGRWEGGVLVLGFVIYLFYTYWEQKKRRKDGTVAAPEVETGSGQRSWLVIFLLFCGGLGGVLISAEWIVVAAPIIAEAFGVPSVIVALTVVALGTSIPEIATCIIAARKGQGSLAVGNILGADILNICWVAGASAMVNPLDVDIKVINFMFPSMLVVVLAMLGLMRIGYRLEKWKGWVLLVLCVVYLIVLYAYF